jgi:hypothetical protein
MNNRLGCLSPLALLSAFVTLVVLVVLEVSSGNSMFSPGALHAAHAEIGKDCGACHAPFWSRGTMSDRCLVCHTNIQGELGDSTSLHGALFRDGFLACQDCHTEHAGPEASLTVMDSVNFPHEVTGFALIAHQTRSPGISFACADCHTESIARFDQTLCAECHRSLDMAFATAHTLEFGNDCLACHDGVDRYGNFDHSRVTFKLTGKHIGAACSACHLNARTVADLQNTPTACESCHRKDDAHDGKFGAQCGVCHSSEGWQPAKFDHNLAAFKLEGKHAEVKCAECHLDGQYQGTPQDCYSCHKADDEHDGAYGTQCEACHNPTDWEDATFDHSLSGFPLDGAHVNVACEECHKNNLFKGTSTSCAACHRDPDFHAGMFPGQACSQCHTTSAWRPARYDGPHTFPMNHGDKNNTCADCHQPNLSRWTCYTCHDQAETAAEHREEGIRNFENCLECHPTGREDEAESKGDDD